MKTKKTFREFKSFPTYQRKSVPEKASVFLTYGFASKANMQMAAAAKKTETVDPRQGCQMA
jgi:hypothetical protein